jgi:hypothetical protein
MPADRPIQGHSRGGPLAEELPNLPHGHGQATTHGGGVPDPGEGRRQGSGMTPRLSASSSRTPGGG